MSRFAQPIAVTVAEVRKQFGGRVALDGVDLELRAGRWTGLIGPNGAGKTTLMSILAGLVHPDAGSIEVFGEALRGPRPDLIGWVPQEIALYLPLTARENLETFGRLHGVSGGELTDRIDWALDWTGLGHHASVPVGHYSGGMKRRLNIACGVMHRPRVVLLDEPTAGVDPQARGRIFTMLSALREDGVALLQSSHDLDDIEATCDTLTVLDRGRVVASGTVDALTRRRRDEPTTLLLEIDGLQGEVPGLHRSPADAGTWQATLTDIDVELPALLERIRNESGRVTGLRMRRPDLNEFFTDLTGTDLRE